HMTAAEVIAVTVRQATRRFPNSFGTCTSWAEREKEIAKATERLESLYAKMRDTWGMADVELSTARVYNGHIGRDVTVGTVAFKLAPDLHPGEPQWPRLLCERLLMQQSIAAIDDKEEISEEEVEGDAPLDDAVAVG